MTNTNTNTVSEFIDWEMVAMVALMAQATVEFGSNDGNIIAGLKEPLVDNGCGVQTLEWYQQWYLKQAPVTVEYYWSNRDSWEAAALDWHGLGWVECDPAELDLARRMFDDMIEMRYEVKVPRQYKTSPKV